MATTSEFNRTFAAGEALEAFRRVKADSTPGQVVYADAADGDNWIGTTVEAVASGDPVTVLLRDGHRTFKIEASGAVTAGNKVYPADDGKVSPTAIRQTPTGTALSATAATGQILELQPLEISGETKVLSVRTAASGNTVIPKPSVALRVVDWWIFSRDTSAANVKLVRNSTDMCTAIAKGTSDDTRVQGATLVDAEDELDPADVLYANLSAAQDVEVYVLAVVR